MCSGGWDRPGLRTADIYPRSSGGRGAAEVRPRSVRPLSRQWASVPLGGGPPCPHMAGFRVLLWRASVPPRSTQRHSPVTDLARNVFVFPAFPFVLWFLFWEMMCSYYYWASPMSPTCCFPCFCQRHCHPTCPGAGPAKAATVPTVTEPEGMQTQTQDLPTRGAQGQNITNCGVRSDHKKMAQWRAASRETHTP